MINEFPLSGGRTATGVIRIENTVRRPIKPRSEFVHSLLKLLEKKGYNFAPRFLGIDEKGREILTFIEGSVPHERMVWTDDQLKKIAQMIKAFHDSTERSKLAGTKEVVCHNDIAPWNTVLNEDMAVAFIDFDDAAPGNRVDDLAYFLWTFLGLGNNVPAKEQATKIKMLCSVYGFSHQQVLVDAILEQQQKILSKREMLAKHDRDSEARNFSLSAAKRIRNEIRWVKSNRKILENIF